MPFCTAPPMGLFETLARDIADAAMVDALGRYGAFVKIVAPIALPCYLFVDRFVAGFAVGAIK